MALEEKGVAYDCVLVDLAAKPEWYKELVPSTKVPAVYFRAGEQFMWESKDVLLALEERFPKVGSNYMLPETKSLVYICASSNGVLGYRT